MKLPVRLFTLFLALELLVSTLGVAHVSHVCRMAFGEKGLSTIPVSDTHPCCPENEFGMCDLTSNEDCCSTEITYMHAEIQGTSSQTVKDSWVKIAIVDLFNEFHFSFLSFESFNYSAGTSGNSFFHYPPLFIIHNTFLI
jgi:hypothetical protein